VKRGLDPAAAELIAAFRSGDRRAFDRLYGEYADRVFRFGLRMCGHEEDARDVLQDTFLNVYRYLPRFRGEASLQAWIFRIASSMCLKRRRRGKYLSKEDVSIEAPAFEGGTPLELEAASPGPARETERSEMQERLAGAIMTLPPSERAALVLRDVEGLTATDAARALGLSVPALKSRLHRARTRVREALEEFSDAG